MAANEDTSRSFPDSPPAPFVSADSHVNESGPAWARVQATDGENAPRVVRAANGTFLVVDGWGDSYKGINRSADPSLVAEGLISKSAFCEEMTHEYVGLAFQSFGDGPAPARDRFKGATVEVRQAGQLDMKQFQRDFRIEDYPAAGLDPVARIGDQDADHIGVEILYPTFMSHLYRLSATNEPFFRRIAHSYNDWLLDEFTSDFPERLIAQPVLSVLDPAGAAADLINYVGRGAKGCGVASSVPRDISYGDPMFDPLWAAAQDCDIPLAMHQSTGNFKHLSGNEALGETTLCALGPDPVRQVMGSHLEIEVSLVEMIVGGVFDRFPHLKIVSAEFDIGWIGHIFQRKPKLGLKRPMAEYLLDNVWFTFQDDRAGCLTTPLFGEKNYLWASDYPHPATTWPNSRDDIDRQFEGIPDNVRYRITNQNAAELYKLESAV